MMGSRGMFWRSDLGFKPLPRLFCNLKREDGYSAFFHERASRKGLRETGAFFFFFFFSGLLGRWFLFVDDRDG